MFNFRSAVIVIIILSTATIKIVEAKNNYDKKLDAAFKNCSKYADSYQPDSKTTVKREILGFEEDKCIYKYYEFIKPTESCKDGKCTRTSGSERWVTCKFTKEQIKNLAEGQDISDLSGNVDCRGRLEVSLKLLGTSPLDLKDFDR